MHDGTVGIDGSLDNLIIVFEIDDDHLRFVIFVDFLSNADIVVRLQSLACGVSMLKSQLMEQGLHTHELNPIEAACTMQMSVNDSFAQRPTKRQVRSAFAGLTDGTAYSNVSICEL